MDYQFTCSNCNKQYKCHNAYTKHSLLCCKSDNSISLKEKLNTNKLIAQQSTEISKELFKEPSIIIQTLDELVKSIIN